jgi:hypothetical protein
VPISLNFRILNVRYVVVLIDDLYLFIYLFIFIFEGKYKLRYRIVKYRTWHAPADRETEHNDNRKVTVNQRRLPR